MKYLFWIWSAWCFLSGSVSKASDPEAPPVEVNAVLGGDVTFPVRITTGYETDKIVCTFNGFNIAEMTPGSNYAVRDERFDERLCAADVNGSLNIRNLTNKDSGLYVMEIYNKKKSFSKETKRYKLAVFSRVKPHITFLLIDRPNGTCHISLNCTVNDRISESYNWSGVNIGPSVEPVMSLNLTESASNRTVCCTVKNPVSHASDCVLPREHCFPDEDQTKSSPGGLRVEHIVVMIFVASVAVCAVVIGILYKLKSAKGREDQADTSPVYPQNSNGSSRSEEGNHYTRTEERNTKPETIYAAVQNTPEMEDLLIPNGNTFPSEHDPTTTYAKLQKPKSNSVEMSKSLLDSGCDSGSPYDEII